MAHFARCYGGYANQFDLPIFYGLPSENPFTHVHKLEEVFASDEVALLHVFPASLRGSAQDWFNFLSPKLTWLEIMIQFFKTFNPSYETHMLLEELSHFSQQDDESLSQCWERFKNCVFSWSSFNCELGSLLVIFCRSLNLKPCQVDFRSTDEFLDKNPEDAWDYLDELTQKLQFCELTESSKDTNSDVGEKEEIEPPYFDQLTDSLSCNQVENFQVSNSCVLEDETIEPLVTNEIVGSPEVQQSSREHSSTLEMDFHNATPEESLSIIVESLLVLDAREKERIEPLVISEGCMPFEESLPIVALNNQILSALDSANPPTESPLSQEVLNVEQIDFLGVDEFNLIYHSYHLDFVNSLKIDLVWAKHLVEFKCLKRIRQMRYSKYLNLWHGRIQFLIKGVEWRYLQSRMCVAPLGTQFLSRWGPYLLKFRRVAFAYHSLH